MPDTNILNEVRKAYRLLFDYQCRILDLVSYIGNSFGYSYKGGWPLFSNVGPRQGKGNLSLWAWDWLNLYYHQFYFGDKQINNHKVYFAVFILNDTGFFTARRENPELSKIDIKGFDKVEDSQTKLLLVCGLNTWFGWKENWNEEKFALEKLGVETDEKGTMFFKSYPLENFFNEKSALSQLEDFEKECALKQIPLKLVKVRL